MSPWSGEEEVQEIYNFLSHSPVGEDWRLVHVVMRARGRC